MTQAYPLHWPQHWPRTQRQQSSRFQTTVSKALNNVTDALRMFAQDSGKKLDNVVISSNYCLGDSNPLDCAVAVYFAWDGINTCIAVDRYNKIQCNLQAIYHCIEAERVKLRHGGLNLVRAAFRGYAALPPPNAAPSEEWWTVLGVPRNATDAQLRKAYKTAATKTHPDKGGSDAAFQRVHEAYVQGQKERIMGE